MVEIVLREADAVLMDRIDRVARRSGWDRATALMHVLERGLDVCEGNGELRLENGETDALQAAYEALNDVPDDPGFARIGRT